MPDGPVRADEALDVVLAMVRLQRRLRRDGHSGAVSPTQLIILALLARGGPLRVGELAVRVPCSQPTATTAVAGLRAAGLVDREPDPADGRATRVVITAAGGATLRSVAHGEAEVLAGLLARIPGADARLVLSAARVLGALADLPAAPGDRTPAPPEAGHG